LLKIKLVIAIIIIKFLKNFSYPSQNPLSLKYCSIVNNLDDENCMNIDAMSYLVKNKVISLKIYAFPPRSKVFELVKQLEDCELSGGEVWILFELTETSMVKRRLGKFYDYKYSRFCRPGSKAELGHKCKNGLGLIGLLRSLK